MGSVADAGHLFQRSSRRIYVWLHAGTDPVSLLVREVFEAEQNEQADAGAAGSHQA